MATNVENKLTEIRHKISVVKENRGNKFKNPHDILTILSLREMELEDSLFFLKSKTSF